MTTRGDPAIARNNINGGRPRTAEHMSLLDVGDATNITYMQSGATICIHYSLAGVS